MSADAAGTGPRAAAAAVVSWLRPHPHRGDVIAAGAVPLALFGVVVALRMVQWPLGAKFGVVAVIAVLLLAMGWLAELESDEPRAYHSVLLVSGLLTLAVALVLFAEVLGATRPPGAGGLTWVFAVVAVVAVLSRPPVELRRVHADCGAGGGRGRRGIRRVGVSPARNGNVPRRADRADGGVRRRRGALPGSSPSARRAAHQCRSTVDGRAWGEPARRSGAVRRGQRPSAASAAELRHRPDSAGSCGFWPSGLA